MELNPDRLETLLSISEQARTPAHIVELERLTLAFEFFSRLREDPDTVPVHKACCKYLQLMRCSKGTEIYEYGNYSKALYGLIKGKLLAKTPEVKEGLDGRRKTLLEPLVGKLLSRVPSITIRDRRPFESEHRSPGRNDRETNKFLIVENEEALMPGTYFGTVEKESKNSATVEAAEDCLLFILTRKQYELALSSVESDRLQRVVQFLSHLGPIAGWTKSSYLKLAKQLTKTILKARSIVFRQGDPANGVFLAQSGEFEFTCKARLLSLESPRTMSREVKNPAEVIIYNTAAPEILGASDLINKRTHQFTCRVISSTAEVYWLSDQEFQDKIVSEASMAHFVNREVVESEWIQSHSTRVGQVRDIMYSKSPIKFPPNEKTLGRKINRGKLSNSFILQSPKRSPEESPQRSFLTPKSKVLTMSKLLFKQLEDSIKPSPSKILEDVTSVRNGPSLSNRFPGRRRSSVLACNFHATGEAALNDKYSKYKFLKLPDLFNEDKAKLAESIRTKKKERRSLMFTEST